MPAPGAGVTAASLRGRFDLDAVGLMGHSRGGEGVVSAATLNQGLADPYGIVSVLPLAPVDFGRMTLPDVPLGVFLPYCDGDVSNQQGQHMVDDSRHAFGDDVLRSAVWVMGANHNFFNTVWTPGLYPYSTSDDWSRNDTTSSCSTRDSSRLTAAQQYQVGVSYMTGFFRLTMGGETQFQPLFDGSATPSTAATTFADVRIMASQPQSATTLVTDFATAGPLVRTTGSASVAVCANAETASSISPSVPYCTPREVGTSRVPHWTPVRFGLNVPAYPVSQFVWNGSASAPAAPSTGELRVSIPAAQRDVSQRAQLTVKAAPVLSVTTGTDFTITVVDGAGATFSAPASSVNPLAVNRLPGGTHATLNKIVLQQLTIPTSEMTGIDLTDVREVRFTAGVGADGTGAGGVFLSDLAFDTPSLGTTVVQTRTTVNIATTRIEEGDAPGTATIAAYLDAPATEPVTGYVSLVAAGPVSAAVQAVTFAPGETCRAISVPTVGDDVPSAVGATGYTVSVTNTQNAVMGAAAFGQLVVREDDGVTSPGVELPPVGVQGDACAELAASFEPTELAASILEAAPGDEVAFTGSGFRVGEEVEFALGDAVVGTVVADRDGVAVFALALADDADLGAQVVRATGAGSARVQVTTLAVLAPTATTLALAPGSSLVAGGPLTFVATVSGAETDGTVTFTDGTELGTAEVVDGVATLTLREGLAAGTYAVAAEFARTDVASASRSEELEVTIAAAPVPGTPGSGGTGSGATGGTTPDWLAVTGADGFGWMLLAAAGLLGTGGALLYVRRRRARVDA